MKTKSYLWIPMVLAFVCLSRQTLAQGNLPGISSTTARWDHCKGPVSDPGCFQLFADGTWNTIPATTNP
jgi:hypothetical protein